MESLKTLKQELINQKEVIESMSGYVSCAHDHPSPAEITEGIKTIPSTDLSDATATEDDVAIGKTFFAGNSIIKTGKGTFDSKTINALFVYNLNEISTTDQLYYSFPSTVTIVRKYMFSENDHNIRITLNPEIEQIKEYAFYDARSIVIENFEDLVNLKTIESYAFQNCRSCGINLGNLPNQIELMNTSCFQNTTTEFFDYKFPDSIKTLGNGIFRQEWRINSGNLDLSNYTTLYYLPAYTFYYHAFNCDLHTPSQITTIQGYFNYNGSFRNVVLSSGITTIFNQAFGANVSQPQSNFYLNTVTFEGETPPSFTGADAFANQHIANGLKIYVPDNAVEEYKAVANLAKCVNCIYPISQKD